MEKAFSLAVVAIRIYACMTIVGIIVNARMISAQFTASLPDRIPAAEVGTVLFFILSFSLVGIFAKLIATFAVNGAEEGESFWSATVLRTGLRLGGLHFLVSGATTFIMLTLTGFIGAPPLTNLLNPLLIAAPFLGLLLTLLAAPITNAFRKADQKSASPTV